MSFPRTQMVPFDSTCGVALAAAAYENRWPHWLPAMRLPRTKVPGHVRAAFIANVYISTLRKFGRGKSCARPDEAARSAYQPSTENHCCEYGDSDEAPNHILAPKEPRRNGTMLGHLRCACARLSTSDKSAKRACAGRDHVTWLSGTRAERIVPSSARCGNDWLLCLDDSVPFSPR